MATGSLSEEFPGESQGHGSLRERNHEGCLEVGNETLRSEDAMKSEGPLAGVGASCGGNTRTRGAEAPYGPHGPVAEARGGRRPSARCPARQAAGPAADWLRRRAEVMLLSVAPPAPGKPGVSAGRRRRRRRPWRQRRRRLWVSCVGDCTSEILVALAWGRLASAEEALRLRAPWALAWATPAGRGLWVLGSGQHRS